MFLTGVPNELLPGVPPNPVRRPPPPPGVPPPVPLLPGVTPLTFLNVLMYKAKLGAQWKGGIRFSTFFCTKKFFTHLVSNGIATTVLIVSCCFFRYPWM